MNICAQCLRDPCCCDYEVTTTAPDNAIVDGKINSLTWQEDCYYSLLGVAIDYENRGMFGSLGLATVHRIANLIPNKDEPLYTPRQIVDMIMECEDLVINKRNWVTTKNPNYFENAISAEEVVEILEKELLKGEG